MEIVSGGERRNDENLGPYARAAQLYRDAGWLGVLPVDSQVRTPSGHTGKNGHYPGEISIDEWIRYRGRDNVGIRMPEDVIGLDVDAYDGKQGAATLTRLEATYGTLPQTWRSTSRDPSEVSGIRWFRVPPGWEWQDAGSGIEVIWRGYRFAFVWPSVSLKTQREYRWYAPDGTESARVPRPDELPELPGEWIDYLSARSETDTGRSRSSPVGASGDAGWIDPQGGRKVDQEAICRGDTSGYSTQREALIALIRSGWAYGVPPSVLRRLGYEAIENLPQLRSGDPWTPHHVDKLVESLTQVPPGKSLPELTPEQLAFVRQATGPSDTEVPADLQADVAQEVRRAMARDLARDIVRAQLAGRNWREPVAEDGEAGLLTDLLAMPPAEEPQLIVGLLGREHNASLAAQYKTGKTTFGLNCVRALVNGEPFVGRETRLPDGARVAWLNGEMSVNDLLGYARPLGIRNPDRVALLNLRGRSLPLLSDHAAEWLVKWLRERDVALWFADSWRVLCAWSGIDENDNTGGGRLTARIDEIKREAGVSAFLTLAHTGRAQLAEGEERARGMTTLDDWVDARWVMTRADRARFLYATGRNVEMEETALTFDPATNRVDAGTGDRRSHRSEAGLAELVAVVTAEPGMNKRRLREALRATEGIDHNTDAIDGLINTALLRGLIHVVAGPNRSQLHHPGPSAEFRWAQRQAGGETSDTSETK